jgi:hypothetical protein
MKLERAAMLALNDTQMVAAADLPVEKRSAFLERIAARLKLRNRPITLDDDFDKLLRSALTGLIQAPKVL